jgi:hypothetical protein
MLNFVHCPPLSFVSPHYIIAFAQLTVGSLCTCNHWGLLLMWFCSTCRDWTCLYMSCQQESTLGSCTGLCWSFIILQKYLWRWIDYFSHCSPLSFQDFREIHLSWEKSCFPCGEFNTMQYPAMMVRTCRTWIFQKVYCLGEFLCVCNHCRWLKSMTLLLYVVKLRDLVCAQFLGCHEQTDGRLNHFVPQ